MADPQQPARRTSHTPVAIFAVDSGGCGACVQSILALQSSRYAKALHAARVSFAQTPRHADVLLISGPLTKAARESIGQRRRRDATAARVDRCRRLRHQRLRLRG